MSDDKNQRGVAHAVRDVDRHASGRAGHRDAAVDVDPEVEEEERTRIADVGALAGAFSLAVGGGNVATGDAVTIEGSLGRVKPNLANARAVVMTATGRKLGAASSEAAP